MNRTPHTPTFTDAMRNFKKALLYNLYCHLPGEIIAYDHAKGTATVQPALQRTIHNYAVAAGQTTQPYPLLKNVPVFILQGGRVSIGADPVGRAGAVSGDPCLLAILDRNIDAWRQNGGAPAPLTDRAHDLADAFAFVGFNPLSAPLASARLTGEVGIAEPLAGTGAKVVVKNGKVAVANNAQNLNTIFQTLFGVLKVDPGLNGASQAALAAAQTALAALLY